VDSDSIQDANNCDGDSDSEFVARTDSVCTNSNTLMMV
jgi:hypothetical protein